MWHGALVVWHGALVVWHGALVVWHGALVVWLGALVVWLGALVVWHETCTHSECSPVKENHVETYDKEPVLPAKEDIYMYMFANI